MVFLLVGEVSIKVLAVLVNKTFFDAYKSKMPLLTAIYYIPDDGNRIFLLQ